jgi:hypothetical protein
MISRVNCPISRSASVDSVVSWLHGTFRIKFLYFFPFLLGRLGVGSGWGNVRLTVLIITAYIRKRGGKERGMRSVRRDAKYDTAEVFRHR